MKANLTQTLQWKNLVSIRGQKLHISAFIQIAVGQQQQFMISKKNAASISTQR